MSAAKPPGAACVLASGPEETDGDGGLEYCVCFGDAEGEPLCDDKRHVWFLWDYDETERFARELAERHRLELINETMRA